MTHDIAQERVAFQPDSSLARSIISETNKLLRWVVETRTKSDKKIPIADDKRIYDVTNHIRKSYVPSLVKIIDRELNANATIYVSPEVKSDLGMCGLFTAYPTEEDLAAVHAARQTTSGLSSAKLADPTFFQDLAKTIDLDSSKLTHKVKGVRFILFIWTSLFMSEEMFEEARQLTAEEIAAVFLHEIGHLMTDIEHLGDLYHRADLVSHSIKFLGNNPDDKSKENVVSTLRTTAAPLAKETDNPELDEVVSKVKEMTIDRFIAPVISVVFGVVSIIFLLSAAWRFFWAGRYGAINEAHDKTSDTVVTVSNDGYRERLADEFVSRHGLGSFLATAHDKLWVLEKDTARREVVKSAFEQTRLCQSFIASYKTLFHFFEPLLEVGYAKYDPPWLRLEHLLQNNLVLFKQEMDPEIRDHFLKETKVLLALVEKYKNSKSEKVKRLLWGTLLRIISRSSILDGFRTANLSHDYDVLQLMTNGLVKNRFNYHANRLKNI